MSVNSNKSVNIKEFSKAVAGISTMVGISAIGCGIYLAMKRNLKLGLPLIIFGALSIVNCGLAYKIINSVGDDNKLDLDESTKSMLEKYALSMAIINGVGILVFMAMLFLFRESGLSNILNSLMLSLSILNTWYISFITQSIKDDN